MKLVFERKVRLFDAKFEDGCQAKILEFHDDSVERVFVRLQSWSENKKHLEFDKLVNKTVRVTVEVVE